MSPTGVAMPAPAKTGNGLHPAVDEFYVPEDIKSKRPRRTKAAVTSIRDHLRALLEQSHPQTVRQVFYAATVMGCIKKNETEYKRTIMRLLVDMRESGEVPFDWIADNTRWMRKPSSFTSVADCLEACASGYRRSPWVSMPHHVEIWCEKDALAGVMVEETAPYDVPLMVAKGYSSISFLHNSAKAIEAKGKPAFIYHFGDLDPSGRDAARDIEAKLRRYAPGAEISLRMPGGHPRAGRGMESPNTPHQTDR
jgi:hypothetical protein